MSNWQVGIAFIRGLNMFGSRRVKAKKVFKVIKHRETSHIRYIGAYKTDNIIQVLRLRNTLTNVLLLRYALNKKF